MPEPLGREPLLGYLRVQTRADKELNRLLNAAAAQASRDIAALSGRGVGAQVRRGQLLHALSAIRREQAELWRQVGSTVNARRATAAAEAAAQASQLDNLMFGLVDKSKEAREALTSANYLTAQSGIEAMGVRVGGQSYHELSQRVYKNAALGSGRVDTLVNSSLAAGLSAREIATRVRQYISPATPGGVSYAAMRLGRTELNNAYHTMSKNMAVGKPWIVGLKWNLSGSHPRPDACNDYADQDHGLGPGVWPAADVPNKPHPQCLCYTTPVVPDRAEFINSYFAGEYDAYLLSIAGPTSGVFDLAELGAATETNPRRLTTGEAKVRTEWNRAAKSTDGWVSMSSREQATWLRSNATTLSKMSIDDIESNLLSWQARVTRVIGPNAKTRGFGESVVTRTPPKLSAAVPTAAVPAKVTADVLRAANERVVRNKITLHDARQSKKTPLSVQRQELMEEMVKFLLDMEERIDGSLHRLADIKVGLRAEFTGTSARANAFYRGNGEMRINPDVIGSPRSWVWATRRSLEAGWYTGSIDSAILDIPGMRTVIHEFGHHLDFQMLDRNVRAEMIATLAEHIGDLDMAEALRLLVRDGKGIDLYNTAIDDWFVVNKAAITRAISEYGSTNAREFLAEVWAGYLLDDPKLLVRQLGAMLEEGSRASQFSVHVRANKKKVVV